MMAAWRIAAREEYLGVLGRAVFNFGYLQWVVVTATDLLTPGYLATHQAAPATAEGLAGHFSRAATQCGFLDAAGHRALCAQADAFKALVARRNELVHGHPLTEHSGAQEIRFGDTHRPLAHSIELVRQAAQDFESAAIDINDSSWQLRGTVEALRTIVRGTGWLMNALQVLAAIEPDAWIAAGAVRNTVWDHLHHLPMRPGSDVDVVLHDAADERAAARVRDRLFDVAPYLQWDVVNQATAHDWQAHQLGRPVEPYRSLPQAMASWPETATAVAVRLNAHDVVEVIAPFGLADLMQMQLRANAGCPDASAFARRMKDKDFPGRWRRLTVHPPGG